MCDVFIQTELDLHLTLPVLCPALLNICHYGCIYPFFMYWTLLSRLLIYDRMLGNWHNSYNYCLIFCYFVQLAEYFLFLIIFLCQTKLDASFYCFSLYALLRLLINDDLSVRFHLGNEVMYVVLFLYRSYRNHLHFLALSITLCS